MQQLLRVKLQPRHCSCRAVDGRREVRDPTGVDCWGRACECQVLSAQSSPRMGGVGWSTPTSRACFLKEARVRDGETAQGPRPLAALPENPGFPGFRHTDGGSQSSMSSVPRGCDTLFWSLWTRDSHVVPMHTRRQKYSCPSNKNK